MNLKQINKSDLPSLRKGIDMRTSTITKSLALEIRLITSGQLQDSLKHYNPALTDRQIKRKADEAAILRDRIAGQLLSGRI